MVAIRKLTKCKSKAFDEICLLGRPTRGGGERGERGCKGRGKKNKDGMEGGGAGVETGETRTHELEVNYSGTHSPTTN